MIHKLFSDISLLTYPPGTTALHGSGVALAGTGGLPSEHGDAAGAALTESTGAESPADFDCRDADG